MSDNISTPSPRTARTGSTAGEVTMHSRPCTKEVRYVTKWQADQ